MVDTTPVFVECPRKSSAARGLFNPKYGWTVYKAQVGIDFLGRIILFSGPHLGTTYDGNIWLSTEHLHPMQPQEWFLGDHHYTVPQVMHGYIRPRLGTLSYDEIFFNTILSHYRSRVEHTNAVLKRHRIFQMVFRGSLSTLTQILQIVAHTTNVLLKQRIRYPPLATLVIVFRINQKNLSFLVCENFLLKFFADL
jgi:hypothetical protein